MVIYDHSTSAFIRCHQHLREFLTPLRMGHFLGIFFKTEGFLCKLINLKAYLELQEAKASSFLPSKHGLFLKFKVLGIFSPFFSNPKFFVQVIN